MQLLPGPKSRKRRAAEEALEAQFARSSSFSPSSSAAAAPCCSSMDDTKRRRRSGQDPDGVTIPPCEGRCDGSYCAWETLPLRLPHIRHMDNTWSSPPPPPSATAERDLNGSCGVLFGTCDVVVVDREEDMPEALQRLRESMRDPVVGLDLEWRPDRGWNKSHHKRSSNQVALLQLATSSLCVLVRICKIGYRLPQCLQDFLRDPMVTLVGFAWDSADSKKFLETFRWHTEDFGRLVDLKHTATSFGYPKTLGLGALASHVLGFQLPKCSMVSLSDWEAPSLSTEQIKYAAMDAFITGHLIRCLGLWHSSPSPCPGCKALLGLPVEQLRPKDLICQEPSCRRSFTSPEAMAHHSRAKQHPVKVVSCELCGRWASVAATSPAAAVVSNAAGAVVEVCCSGSGTRTASGRGITVGA